jgi:hypothetical protein
LNSLILLAFGVALYFGIFVHGSFERALTKAILKTKKKILRERNKQEQEV